MAQENAHPDEHLIRVIDQDEHSSQADSSGSKEEPVGILETVQKLFKWPYNNQTVRSKVTDRIGDLRKRSEKDERIKPTKVRKLQKAYKKVNEELDDLKRQFAELDVPNVELEEAFHEIIMAEHMEKKRALPKMRALLRTHVKKARKLADTEDENDTDYTLSRGSRSGRTTPSTSGSRGPTPVPVSPVQEEFVQADRVFLAAVREPDEVPVTVEGGGGEQTAEELATEQNEERESPEPLEPEIIITRHYEEENLQEGPSETEERLSKVVDDLKQKMTQIEGNVQQRIQAIGDQFRQYTEEMVTNITAIVSNEAGRVNRIEKEQERMVKDEKTLKVKVGELDNNAQKVNDRVKGIENEIGGLKEAAARHARRGRKGGIRELLQLQCRPIGSQRKEMVGTKQEDGRRPRIVYK